MIDLDSISDTIAIYEKYGWILRRLLFSPEIKVKMGNGQGSRFGDVAVMDSGIDAAWFSRPPQRGGIAWELRYLGDPPFALLENIDEADPEFENLLRSVEARLRESIAAKISA